MNSKKNIINKVEIFPFGIECDRIAELAANYDKHASENYLPLIFEATLDGKKSSFPGVYCFSPEKKEAPRFVFPHELLTRYQRRHIDKWFNFVKADLIENVSMALLQHPRECPHPQS